MTLREKIEVMEAFERGDEVEINLIGTEFDGGWLKEVCPQWNWCDHEYRVKPKPKQTVTIEKWLCKSAWAHYFIIEGEAEYFKSTGYVEHKVKLLDTYEVEL